MKKILVYLLVPHQKYAKSFDRRDGGMAAILRSEKLYVEGVHIVRRLPEAEFAVACEQLGNIEGLKYDPRKQMLTVNRRKFFKKTLEEVKKVASSISKWGMDDYLGTNCFGVQKASFYDLENAYNNYHGIYIINGFWSRLYVEEMDNFYRHTRGFDQAHIQDVFECECLPNGFLDFIHEYPAREIK